MNKNIIDDIMLDYGSQDEKGTYTTGQYDLLVHRILSEISDQQIGGRFVGKTWKAFTKCLQWAQQGKTFIYVHPRFVAIDTKTWLKLNKKEIDHKMVFFEEYQPWSKEMQAELDKIKRPIIDNEKFRQEYTGDWDTNNKEEKS